MLEQKREDLMDRSEINPYVTDLASQLFRRAADADLNFDSRGWQVVTEILSYAASAEQRISEQEQRIMDLERLSVTDELTGLPNLRGLRSAFSREMSIGARTRDNGVFAFIDLDDFKTINDTFGHDIGDRALRHAAKTLKRHIRPSDTLARIAGDEFALLMPACTFQDGVSRMQTLQARLESTPLRLDEGQTLHLKCSVGCERFSGASNTMQVINRADAAMYANKKARKVK